jgi:hypothetical protein
MGLLSVQNSSGQQDKCLNKEAIFCNFSAYRYLLRAAAG